MLRKQVQLEVGGPDHMAGASYVPINEGSQSLQPGADTVKNLSEQSPIH